VNGGFVLMTTPWFQWFSLFAAGVSKFFPARHFIAGMAATQNRRLQYGHAVRARFDNGVRLQRVGIVERPLRAFIFQEAAGNYHAHQRRSWLEARVSDKAGGALNRCLTLRRKRPNSESEAGSQNRKSKFPSQNKIGDEIVFVPVIGIPVDGIVIEGESAVENPHSTWRIRPVDKKNGGELFAGTVTLNGRLVMRVTATGRRNRARKRHRRCAARANHPRHPPSRPCEQRLVPVVVAIGIAAGLCGTRAGIGKHFSRFSRAFFGQQSALDSRRDSSLPRQFNCPVSVRDGFGDSGGDHGRRKRPPRAGVF